MNFEALHHQERPLLIANVWDVPSAKATEGLGYQALGTSSAAIATSLGLRDGEAITFSSLLDRVSQISHHTQLPLTVDIEAGYSRASKQIIKNVLSLAEHGVVGINIEDSLCSPKRELIAPTEMAKTVEQIKQTLAKQGVDIFINVRTDAYILQQPNALQETLARIPLYEAAGADGIFVPCLVAESDISSVVSASTLPVNVMCMPALPSFNILANLGVKRVSMGNFLYECIHKHLRALHQEIMERQSFKPLFT